MNTTRIELTETDFEMPQPLEVAPLDVLHKLVAVSREQMASFPTVEPVYTHESDEDTDFDAMSDVEDDYECNYVRHESRTSEDNDTDVEEEEEEVAFQYFYPTPQYTPRDEIRQQGKSVKLVRRHYDGHMAMNRLGDFDFEFRGPSFVQPEDPLSPTSCYVYTEEIGPGEDDCPSSSDSPDTRDDADYDTLSDDTLVDDTLSAWLEQKEATICDAQLFY